MATNEEVIVKLTNVEGKCDSNTHRIEKVEEKQECLDNLVTAFATMVKEQEYIKDDVTEIKSDVKVLTEKPVKRWDGLVEKAIGLLVAGGFGYFLALLGLS